MGKPTCRHQPDHPQEKEAEEKRCAMPLAPGNPSWDTNNDDQDKDYDNAFDHLIHASGNIQHLDS